MAARERLILNLFSLGTNTELKRLHAAANPECSYDDLLYFRKRFIRIPLVREAIAALTNRILEIRNHKIWRGGRQPVLQMPNIWGLGTRILWQSGIHIIGNPVSWLTGMWKETLCVSILSLPHAAHLKLRR